MTTSININVNNIPVVDVNKNSTLRFNTIEVQAISKQSNFPYDGGMALFDVGNGKIGFRQNVFFWSKQPLQFPSVEAAREAIRDWAGAHDSLDPEVKLDSIQIVKA